MSTQGEEQDVRLLLPRRWRLRRLEEGIGGSVNNHGRSAPNESFSYPAEDAASAAAAAEAAPAVMEFAAPPAAVITEAAPAAVMEAAPEAPAAVVAPVVEAAQSVMAAAVDALPSPADVAEVVTKVAEAAPDMRDMALPDFSAL